MPILEANAFEFFSRSPDQTRRVGMRLGAILRCGDVVCLDGELGSGKTTLVQGLASGWGSTDPVSSPTFVIINLYRRTDVEKFTHLDAYRLNGPAEAEALDIDELIANGPLVVEWAPRILDSLPDENLYVQFAWVEEEHRRMQFTANGGHYEEMLTTFQENMLRSG
ncbi:MAG: tRNA (adenosine(37)-N6)-threonylcarbamoyltransferase complex ATPase subunit type 1 TsaE [Anaerolineales bacterium]|nr:MAG: tRNA (adenosine(37)-N6)-threonylcarbamoyltransferase complex ATPase subunit type 1 TsaE [Anaerolineales bacterium]